MENVMKTTIELNPNEIGVTTYAGYSAFEETDVNTIHPLMLNTHGLNPFKDNQGIIKFNIPGDKLLGAIETHPKRKGNEIFHFLVPGGPVPLWDYARTFSLVNPTISRADIVPEKMYETTLVGGCGYVHIEEVNDNA